MSESDYLAHVATGSTTRARCWRLTRRDGLVLGFTDHDRDIAFGGITFAAGAALSASEAASSLGLSVDDQEALGALASGAITERDLRRGLYDGATVDVWDVNWSDPSARIAVGTYRLGEVARSDGAFRAEMRSRSGALAAKAGRRFLSTCDATIGDARCGVALASPAYTGAGLVEGLAGTRLTASGLASFPSGHFDRGVLTFTGGANAGRRLEVRAFAPRGARQVLDLWQAPPDPPARLDPFTVSAGCDKTFATCRDRFLNAPNFRGFPHMPGESFVAEYVAPGDSALDGGSRHGSG